jgi:prepilin-type N-terminal cleavage/methylation domain-containing protein
VNDLKGFTLIEIMISVVVLGAGLALVANSYLVALRGINSTQNNIQATVFAREKLEAAQSASLKDGLSVSSVRGTLQSSGKQYKYTFDTTEITQPDYIAKDFVQACAKVSWQEQNAEKNVILSTYLPRQKD